jgi:hypothetical protein
VRTATPPIFSFENDDLSVEPFSEKMGLKMAQVLENVDKLSLSELAGLSSDDKLEIILSLRAKLKQCQNHRGNRIDIETFVKFEEELKVERDQVTSLRAEIGLLKAQLSNRVSCTENEEPIKMSSHSVCMRDESLQTDDTTSQPVQIPVIVQEQSQQTEAIITVNVASQAQDDIDSQTNKLVVEVCASVDCGCQTEPNENEMEKCFEVHDKPPPTMPKTMISPFIVPNFTDADSALVFEELTSIYKSLREMTCGGDDSDMVWRHSCSCGFFAALSSLRRRGEECAVEIDSLRTMASQLLEKKVRKVKDKKSASSESSGGLLPPVAKRPSLNLPKSKPK